MSILSNHTVKHIHSVIHKTSCLSAAAKKLKLVDSTILTSHLGKFLLNGEPLTLDVFKNLSLEEAQDIWGTAYTQKMPSPEININQYQAAHIHYLARKADNVRNLASSLGVRDHTVLRYLKKTKMNGCSLTFDQLKSLSAKQALCVFGEAYQANYPSQRINLTPKILEKSVPVDSLQPLENDDLLFLFDDDQALPHSPSPSLPPSAGVTYPLFALEEHSFDALAARFKDQFPLQVIGTRRQTRSSNKRNPNELFSNSVLSDASLERPIKKSRAANTTQNDETALLKP